MASERIIDDVTLRCYFAAVIGGFRQPYGKKDLRALPAGVVRSALLAQNSTKDRALSVLVSRGDAGANVFVRFTQNVNGVSTNDFAVTFTAATQQRFVLRPGETLVIESSGGAAAEFVVQQETY